MILFFNLLEEGNLSVVIRLSKLHFLILLRFIVKTFTSHENPKM